MKYYFTQFIPIKLFCHICWTNPNYWCRLTITRIDCKLKHIYWLTIDAIIFENTITFLGESIMKLNTKEIILVGLFAALTAAGAFIQVPLGTVPITLQFLFTGLSGVILGGKLGALSQLVYVAIGLFGIPVFAGGAGGIGSIVKPSFGYLIGFIIGAYVIGKLAEGKGRVGFVRLFMASMAGIIVIYAVGVPYLYLIIKNVIGKDISITTALKTGFLVFLPGDLLKCGIVAWLGVRCQRKLQKSNLA